MKKQRLDVLLVERGLAPSREKARARILAGLVLVNDSEVSKAGHKVPVEAELRLREGAIQKFVGRGGHKLEGALEDFPDVRVEGRVCADLGASTGGFTDCLLQRGATRVYAIDVGYGQLAWRLRQDDRVEVMERTNARHLESLPEPIELVVGDLSFISLSKVLPAIRRITAPGGDCVLLVKPQFELGPGAVKGGVVRDPAQRLAAVEQVLADARTHGFEALGHTESKLPGAKKGNIEQLIWIRAPEPT
ncbi:MAG: TlyA family RNA methyltransferase [Proteobacteria bacterium]|nr:TlyA family RNA methyltransferase [Pseudomonadota bacterium]MCP4920858.1 TlyA family RNA methyltransferase [Pseudomonadota bacterium]